MEKKNTLVYNFFHNIKSGIKMVRRVTRGIAAIFKNKTLQNNKLKNTL